MPNALRDPFWASSGKPDNLSCSIFGNIRKSWDAGIREHVMPKLRGLLIRKIGKIGIVHDACIGDQLAINVHLGDGIGRACLSDNHLVFPLNCCPTIDYAERTSAQYIKIHDKFCICKSPNTRARPGKRRRLQRSISQWRAQPSQNQPCRVTSTR